MPSFVVTPKSAPRLSARATSRGRWWSALPPFDGSRHRGVAPKPKVVSCRLASGSLLHRALQCLVHGQRIALGNREVLELEETAIGVEDTGVLAAAARDVQVARAGDELVAARIGNDGGPTGSTGQCGRAVPRIPRVLCLPLR